MANWNGSLDTAVLRSHADFVEARFDSELQPDAQVIARDMRLLADELEAARERIATLEDALRPFADAATRIPSFIEDHHQSWSVGIPAADYRAAHAALEG